MQDCFVGDIGDFGKYGLLRVLTQGLAGCMDGKPSGFGDGERQLKLGVIWHYVAAPGQLPPLGLAFKYILDPNALERDLIQCDPELYEILRGLIQDNRRSVEAVEQSAALPEGTVYFREPLNGGLVRVEWFERAAQAVSDCDLVFLDPDNGLVDDGGNPNRVNKKFTSYQEVVQLWEQGKSLMLYQDAARRDVPAFAKKQASRLRGLLPGAEPIALWYHRRGPRIFWVIPNPADPEAAQLLRDRVQAFLDCGWGTSPKPHFTRVDC